MLKNKQAARTIVPLDFDDLEKIAAATGQDPPPEAPASTTPTPTSTKRESLFFVTMP